MCLTRPWHTTSRNMDSFLGFAGPSPTFPHMHWRSDNCGQMSTRVGRWRIGSVSYFLMSQNSCYSSQMAASGGGSLMVWGCITAEGMGRLHWIDGIMKGVDYVKILDDNLLGTLKDQKLKKTGKYGIIFQQDNDPKHTSHVASNWFEEKRIKKLSWPPSSPDMNIIEHVWHQLD